MNTLSKFILAFSIISLSSITYASREIQDAQSRIERYAQFLDKASLEFNDNKSVLYSAVSAYTTGANANFAQSVIQRSGASWVCLIGVGRANQKSCQYEPYLSSFEDTYENLAFNRDSDRTYIKDFALVMKNEKLKNAILNSVARPNSHLRDMRLTVTNYYNLDQVTTFRLDFKTGVSSGVFSKNYYKYSYSVTVAPDDTTRKVTSQIISVSPYVNRDGI